MDQVPNHSPPIEPPHLVPNHSPILGLYQPTPPGFYQPHPLLLNQSPPVPPYQPPPLGLYQSLPEAPPHPPPQGPPQPNPQEHNSQPPLSQGSSTLSPHNWSSEPLSQEPSEPLPLDSSEPSPAEPPKSSLQGPSILSSPKQPSEPSPQEPPKSFSNGPLKPLPIAQTQPSPQAQCQPPPQAQCQPPPQAQCQPPSQAQSQPSPQAQPEPPPPPSPPEPRGPLLRGTLRRRNRANPLVQVRDRLFYALFFKSALVYARIFPKPLRRLIEFLLLLSALSSFLILVYVHYIFSYKPASCLESIADSWPRDGIVRIQVVKEGADMNGGIDVAYLYRQNSAYQKHDSDLSKKIKKVLDKIEFENAFTNIQLSPSDNLFSPEKAKSKQRRNVNNSSSLSVSYNHLSGNAPTDVHLMKTDESYIISEDVKLLKIEEDSQNESFKASYNYYEDIEETEVPEEGSSNESNYIVEYSLEYGMLRLSPLTREKLNIPVMIVSLNPSSHACFGDTITRTILSEFLGYDDVLMSSAKALAEKEQNKGYLRNVITGEQFRFVTMWMSRSSYIAAFFVMLLFTVTISMLLRYSHHQIFVLIVDILQMLEFNLAGILPATPLLTVIMALIGMEAIMSEFFNDTTTAFYVILIVWSADQYDAVFCHTYISKKYWARFFFLYHFHFYAYHYRFNGQYSGLALVSSFLFILHSMVYFFHHFELPEILQQAQIQEILLHDLRVLSNHHTHRLRRGFLVPRAQVTVQDDPFDSENSFGGNDPDSEHFPDNESNGSGPSRLANGVTLADAMDNISRQLGRTIQGPRVPLISDLRVLVTDFNDILVADRSANARNPSSSGS